MNHRILLLYTLIILVGCIKALDEDDATYTTSADFEQLTCVTFPDVKYIEGVSLGSVDKSNKSIKQIDYFTRF